MDAIWRENTICVFPKRKVRVCRNQEKIVTTSSFELLPEASSRRTLFVLIIMRTSQLKNSICDCSTNNGHVNDTFGRCSICYRFMTNVHGGRTLCGCTTSRGNPQRFDRCKTCNPAGPSVSLVHKTSVNKRTAGAPERVYTALPEVFYLALSLSRSLLLLSSLSPCSLSRALCPVSLYE